MVAMETPNHVDRDMPIKLLPDEYRKKSPSLVAFALILKKLLTFKVAESRISPPGLNRVNEINNENVQIATQYFYFGISAIPPLA